jgi:hypothetical protein
MHLLVLTIKRYLLPWYLSYSSHFPSIRLSYCHSCSIPSSSSFKLKLVSQIGLKINAICNRASNITSSVIKAINYNIVYLEVRVICYGKCWMTKHWLSLIKCILKSSSKVPWSRLKQNIWNQSNILCTYSSSYFSYVNCTCRWSKESWGHY